MTAHQQTTVERCRDEFRALLEALKAIPGLKLLAVNVEEQERAACFGEGTHAEMALYVTLAVTE